jgi:hypothetical protein
MSTNQKNGGFDSVGFNKEFRLFHSVISFDLDIPQPQPLKPEKSLAAYLYRPEVRDQRSLQPLCVTVVAHREQPPIPPNLKKKRP